MGGPGSCPPCILTVWFFVKVLFGLELNRDNRWSSRYVYQYARRMRMQVCSTYLRLGPAENATSTWALTGVSIRLHPSPSISIHMGSNVHGHVHAHVHGSHPPTTRSISDQGAWIGSHIPMCCILYSSPAGSLVAQRRHGRQAIS